MTECSRELAMLLDSAAADLGGPVDPAATLARLPAVTRHALLSSRDIPDSLVAWAFAHAPINELRVLADNPHIGRDTVARLAEVDDDAILVRAYRHPRATDALRRRILAADRLPEALHELLLTTRVRRLLAPALGCRHPSPAARAGDRVTGPRRRRPENAPGALYDWFHGTSRVSPNARGLLRGRRALFDLRRWSDADWAELAALHNRSPLDNASRSVLLEAPECPRATGLALLRTDDTAEDPGDALLVGLTHKVFSPHDVVHRAPYAAHVLRALESLERDADEHAEPPVAAELRAELTALVGARLGAVPARWRSVLAHLTVGDFPGTLPELCAAARGGPGPAYRPRPWPHVQQVSWSPFTQLLRHTDPAGLTAVLGALDPHDLGELAHHDIRQPLPDALVDAFLDHARPGAVDVFLTHHGHHDATRARLLRRDDPELNAALLRRPDTPSRAWYTVASGVPQGPGRTALVPLSPETRTALRGGARHNHGADVVRHAVHTRDADLIVSALRHPQPTLTAAHQITGCRRLVELGRMTELTDLARPHGPLDPLLATRVRTGLGVTRPGAADSRPQRLRTSAALLRALDRAQFLYDLQHGSLDALRGQIERDEPPPWDAVRTLVTAGRLPQRALDLLAERPDCPEPVALALLEHDREHTAVPLALTARSRSLALGALARQPVIPEWLQEGWPRLTLVWPVACLRAGNLTPDDVFAFGRPARAVLRLTRMLPRELADIRERIASEVTARHAGSPDTWAVVAAMLGSFTGTLPELLTTASAATAPVDRAETAPGQTPGQTTRQTPGQIPGRIPRPA